MNKKRIEWLDMARTIAIFLVVLNHAVQYIYGFDLNAWKSYSLIDNIVKTFFLHWECWESRLFCQSLDIYC